MASRTRRVDGQGFIAMEFVQGKTLADKLAAGPLPIPECLRIGSEIAEALEKAHQSQIVHRDLKPSNIMITPEGHVKVMDFGLAKRVASDHLATDEVQLTSLTQEGSLLGTVPYMSPEQLRGGEVDTRSNIFSFGIILYEMISAVHPFLKTEAMETAGAILKDAPPPLARYREEVSEVLQHLVRKMLAKEPKSRYQLAHDIHTDLVALQQDPGPAAVLAGQIQMTPPARWQSLLPWAVSGLLAVFVVLLAFWRPWESSPEPEPPRRLEVSIGADASFFDVEGETAAVLSPDGSLLAFVARSEGSQQQLYVRPLDQLQATPLSGTEGVRQPFFSTDGQWIGFFADGKLKKISVTGGTAITLCDAPNSRGGDWGDDGSIVFAGTREGLSRVSSAGGTPQPLTTLDEEAGEIAHWRPQLLPGSKAVLFTAWSTLRSEEDFSLVVQTIPSGQRKIVQRGGYHWRYLPSGHLLYIHEGTLFAAPFDVQKLELTGQVVPILEGVLAYPNAVAAAIAFSQEGTLVYLPDVATTDPFTLNWLDRNGETKPLLDVPGDYRDVRFAPGGQRLAVEIREGARSDIWAYEWVRGTLTRLTFDAANEADPLWSPNGDSLVFFSGRERPGNLYWKRSDGSGEVQLLTESRNVQYPMSWHPTGKFLAISELERDPEVNQNIWILALEGDDRSGWKPGQVTTFLNSPFAELYPAFSPDGRWLAYQSNESGQNEIYVRPFPDSGGKWPVSSGGGTIPIWSENGWELFYLSGNQQIMVATYSAEGESFKASKPGVWSEVRIADRRFDRVYDLHPDGERFAVLMAAQEEKRDHVILIENFFELFRQELGSQ